MNKDRRWIYIGILCLIIGIVWVAVTVIVKTRQSTVPQDLERVMRPLNPVIDRAIFTKLATRKPITGI